MAKPDFIYAKNLPSGSFVSLFCETWIVKGVVCLYDGTLEFYRVSLVSRKDSNRFHLLDCFEPMFKISFNTFTTKPF